MSGRAPLRRVALDPAVRRLVDGALHPPYLYEMDPVDGRCALAEMQTAAGPAGTTERILTVPTRDGGSVDAHLIEPAGPGGPRPVILYAHGGGWAMGDHASHARFAREIAVRSGVPVLLPEYALAPEHHFPVAFHQLADTLTWVVRGGLGDGFRADRVGLLGDCAGATMMAAVALTTAERAAVHALAMLYPFSAPLPFDSSAVDFARGYALRLDDVDHLWLEYAPREDDRTTLAAAPLTSPAADLTRLPPTLVVTAEADVTRDRAEAFATRIRDAGGDVTCARYLGTVHDFAVLDALRRTPAARAALAQTAQFLRDMLDDADRGWL